MWKKEETPADAQTADPTKTLQWPTPTPTSAPAAAPTASTAPVSGSADRATIGRSIHVRGDVTGDEDLLIQGRVEGSVNLRQHSVTVGSDGEVIASIAGRVVTVEGRVEGNIDGGEQVILRSSAHVKGDIKSPRVVLENGARFRGLVDMGEEDERALSNSGASRFEAGKGTQKGRAGGEPATAQANESGKAPENGSPVGNGAADEGKASVASASGAGSPAGGASGKGRKPSDAESQIAH